MTEYSSNSSNELESLNSREAQLQAELKALKNKYRKLGKTLSKENKRLAEAREREKISNKDLSASMSKYETSRARLTSLIAELEAWNPQPSMLESGETRRKLKEVRSLIESLISAARSELKSTDELIRLENESGISAVDQLEREYWNLVEESKSLESEIRNSEWTLRAMQEIVENTTPTIG